jgi:PPOX class probable F420-dependent enzyme|tara:strand:+ start:1138 stop:1569 length:432 start_codon:yes stop_codon:yes gene_type:complete
LETEFASKVVQDYLKGKEVGVLATINSDGSPLAMPMWFVHDNDALALVSQAADMKIRNLHRDPRVGFVIESGSGDSIACVILQGSVRFLTSESDRSQVGARFIDKYGTHMVERWNGRSVPESRALFRIEPRRVKVWGALASPD